jgi:thiol-disulfide isomerase/thioredoxin
MFNRRSLLLATLPLAHACTAPNSDETSDNNGSSGPAPRFHAKTLDGQTFDNQSLKGKVVLIQFWATWCGFCRRDQPAVDKVTKEFAPQGLTVLAVNVGEPRLVVEGYLENNPRACHIVLSKESNLQQAFKADGFPKYVVIDREGRIAANQQGAGGIIALRDLLSNAGLRSATPAG